MLQDLPRYRQAFFKRFGTDARCRACFVRARRPAVGIRCSNYSHGFMFGPLIGDHLGEVFAGRLDCSSFRSWLKGTPAQDP